MPRENLESVGDKNNHGKKNVASFVVVCGEFDRRECAGLLEKNRIYLCQKRKRMLVVPIISKTDRGHLQHSHIDKFNRLAHIIYAEHLRKLLR